MMKNLGLVISLTLVCFWVESKPVTFSDIDVELSDLSFEVEEEDLDDVGKLLDAADEKSKTTNIQTSGFKKKKSSRKGLKGNKKEEQLKKFYNNARKNDQGSYDDDDLYGEVEGVAAQAVGVTGKEDRKYRKGTKTRGFHRVHHKDEYKKDKVIYEDDETSGVIKKVGAKGLGYRVGGGAGFSKGHFHHDHKKGVYGKQGYLDKGSLEKQLEGYSNSQGFDGSFSQNS